jgi:hypothetical protein
MKPVSPVMPGSASIELVYGKDQSEYEPLPGVYLDTPSAPVVMRWRFTDEERAKIAAGGDIVITILRFRKLDGSPRPLPPSHLQVCLPDEMPELLSDPEVS